MNFKKIFCLTLNVLCTVTILFILNLSKVEYSSVLKIIVSVLTALTLLLSIIFIRAKYIKACKVTIICNCLLTFVFVLYHILNVSNMLYIFKSVNNFRYFIISTGSKGIFIYVLIQALQVVILPVPAAIIALAGAVVYGPFWGFVYCSLGILLGSYASFILGRTVGQRLVVWVAGKETATKYADILNNSGKLFLGLAFLLPFFPDDVLCLIAGITSMSFKYFFIVTTLFRPIGVFFMCYFGGGYVIPFSGWGLYVWAGIVVVMSVLVILTYKYQGKIEEWLVNKFKKKNKAK